jgi:uncharacterized membrane protein YagU involved in acid resistance
MQRALNPFQTIKTIFLAGLVAGTLDILAAIVILSKMNAEKLLQYVASGVYGKAAFEGGAKMAWAGLGFHYLIACCFAAFFYILFNIVPFVRKYKIVSGLLFGIFVWIVMNLIVLPFTNVSRGSFTVKGVVLNMTILMLAMGLPISIITNKISSKKKVQI